MWRQAVATPPYAIVGLGWTGLDSIFTIYDLRAGWFALTVFGEDDPRRFVWSGYDQAICLKITCLFLLITVYFCITRALRKWEEDLEMKDDWRMVRTEFHDGSNTHGAGESGVAAALPPSLCFGAAGCHRGPRCFTTLDTSRGWRTGGCATLLRITDPRSTSADVSPLSLL